MSEIAIRKIEWADPVEVSNSQQGDCVSYDGDNKVINIWCKSCGVGLRLTLTGMYSAKLDRLMLSREMKKRMQI